MPLRLFYDLQIPNVEQREDAEKEVVKVIKDMAVLRCAVVAMVFGEFS